MRVLLLSFTIVLSLLVFSGVFANGAHAPEEEHDAQVQRVDRSVQFPTLVGGFLVGLIVGAVATKFIFRK